MLHRPAVHLALISIFVHNYNTQNDYLNCSAMDRPEILGSGSRIGPQVSQVWSGLGLGSGRTSARSSGRVGPRVGLSFGSRSDSRVRIDLVSPVGQVEVVGMTLTPIIRS